MSSSPPEPEPLARLLWRAHGWFRSALVAALEAQDDPTAISPAQVTLLSQLPTEGTSIAELARRLGVSPPTAHQWVHELAAMDIVTVEARASSARTKLVRLTETGQRRRVQALQTMAGLEAALADRIGPAAVAALRGALEAPWGPPETAAEELAGATFRRQQGWSKRQVGGTA
jgi:DNA-binding MarR family transcriptional regulator